MMSLELGTLLKYDLAFMSVFSSRLRFLWKGDKYSNFFFARALGHVVPFRYGFVSRPIFARVPSPGR